MATDGLTKGLIGDKHKHFLTRIEGPLVTGLILWELSLYFAGN